MAVSEGGNRERISLYPSASCKVIKTEPLGRQGSPGTSKLRVAFESTIIMWMSGLTH